MIILSANGQTPKVSTTTKNTLSKGASILFKNVRTQLFDGEKNEIFWNLRFVLSNDGEPPFALNAQSLEYPFPARALPTDMNKDGKEELFILYGNAFTSGNTGSSVFLLIKNLHGRFQNNLGFPGIPQILPETNKGYHDLLIGGPGFEFPVWRWNGKEYTIYKTIKDFELEKVRTMEVDELSSTYQETLNK